jgi:hypothetical protein
MKAAFFRDGGRGLLVTGQVVEEKEVFRGCAGWVGTLQARRAPVSALDLANTVMVHRVPHHFALGQGHWEDEVREVLAWLKIEDVGIVGPEGFLQTPP